MGFRVPYSRSPKVGNPIASILKTNVQGIPALFGLNPVSNFMGFAVEFGGSGDWGFLKGFYEGFLRGMYMGCRARVYLEDHGT